MNRLMQLRTRRTVWSPGQKPPYGARLKPYHPLSQGLFHAFLINEQGGKDIYDAITLQPATAPAGHEPVWLDHPGGKCLDFSTSSNINSPDSTTPYLGPITLVYAIQLDTTAGTYHVHIGKGINGQQTPFMVLHGGGTNSLLLYRGSSTGYRGYYKQNLLETKYTVFGVVAGSTIQTTPAFYKNGALVGGAFSEESTGTGTPQGISDPFYISNNNSLYSFDGKLFYVYLWNRQLTSSEIASLYANPYQMFWHPVYDFLLYPAAAGLGKPLIDGCLVNEGVLTQGSIIRC